MAVATTYNDEHSAIHGSHDVLRCDGPALQVYPHEVVCDLQWTLIGAANVLNERIDLLRSHQIDRQVFGRRALEHRTQGVNVSDIKFATRCLTLHSAASLPRSLGLVCANIPYFGVPPVFDECFSEGALMDEQIGVARDSRAMSSQGAVSPLKVMILPSASMRKP